MKKELKFNQITIILGLFISMIGLILTPLVDDISQAIMFFALLSDSYISVMLIILLGGTFIFAKNIIVKNIGYGLCGFSLIFGLPYVIQGTLYTGLLIFGIGTILMCLGSLLYTLSLILDYFDFY